tara:strand:- start:468 stop:1517 length:1050 start_codon:yes stop_codon:yes gene_type:complete
MRKKVNITAGKNNLISDVEGIEVGNAENVELNTGLTFLKLNNNYRASAFTFGSAPASREVELLQPNNTIEFIDGISLSGGSVFGLASGAEYVDFLKQENRGYKIKDTDISIPIVPCAGIYDITKQNYSALSSSVYKNLSHDAYLNSSKDFLLGNSGAGIGAIAGTHKGGLGSASTNISDDIIIGAITIVNSVGSTVVPGTRLLYSSIYELDGEMGNNLRENVRDFEYYKYQPDITETTKLDKQPKDRQNTTISVIATNLDLSKLELYNLAKMSASGLSRAIRPAGTSLDGDIIFAISSCKRNYHKKDYNFSFICSAASDTLTRAIGRAVFNAKGINGVKSVRDIVTHKE